MVDDGTPQKSLDKNIHTDGQWTQPPLRYPLSEIWPCTYPETRLAGEFHLATVLIWSWNPRISGRTHFLLWHVWCWEIFIGSTRHKVGMLFLLPWLFLDGFHYPPSLVPLSKGSFSCFFLMENWRVIYMQASCPKQMWKHMCWRPNSHWFPVVRDGHQACSRGLYTHYNAIPNLRSWSTLAHLIFLGIHIIPLRLISFSWPNQLT